MTPVMQTITDPNRGDCLRAVIATLLDLEIVQVPHFRLFNDNWWRVYSAFLNSVGYEFNGTGHYRAKGYTPRTEHLEKFHVGGYVEATVPSKNYLDVTHAVVMNRDGLVVHDPHPGKAWEGINVIESGDLVSWSLIGRYQD